MPMVKPNPKTGEKAEKGSAAGWFLLVFTASACMFILGVLVGRNTAPVHFDMENLNKKLSQLQDSVLAGKTGRQTESEKIPNDISFEFYDKLKEKSQTDEYAEGRPRVLSPKYEKPSPSKIRARKAEPARAAGKAGKEASSPTPPASQEKMYAIQVASLRDPGKAEKVRNKFRNKGYPAFTQVALVEGKGRWCRVRLGPYKNRAQAEDDLERLQKAGVDAILFLSDSEF